MGQRLPEGHRVFFPRAPRVPSPGARSARPARPVEPATFFGRSEGEEHRDAQRDGGTASIRKSHCQPFIQTG